MFLHQLGNGPLEALLGDVTGLPLPLVSRAMLYVTEGQPVNWHLFLADDYVCMVTADLLHAG